MNAQPLVTSPVAPEPSPETGADALYAVGYRLLDNEHVTDAANVFRVLLRAAPTDERGWLALGRCHERVDQWRIALELYAAGAIAAEPSARCHLARARVLRVLGDTAAAEEAIEAAAVCAEGTDDYDLIELIGAEGQVRR